MSDDTPAKGGNPEGPSAREQARAARQAAALRENLRKRNAQRRERRTNEPDSGAEGDDA